MEGSASGIGCRPADTGFPQCGSFPSCARTFFIGVVGRCVCVRIVSAGVAIGGRVLTDCAMDAV
jgi:hypothetical protein